MVRGPWKIYGNEQEDAMNWYTIVLAMVFGCGASQDSLQRASSPDSIVQAVELSGFDPIDGDGDGVVTRPERKIECVFEIECDPNPRPRISPKYITPPATQLLTEDVVRKTIEREGYFYHTAILYRAMAEVIAEAGEPKEKEVNSDLLSSCQQGWHAGWRGAVIDVVRWHLSDPDRLWAMYQSLKPKAIEMLKKGDPERIADIQGILSVANDVLSKPIPRELRQLAQEEVNLWRECELWQHSHSYDSDRPGIFFVCPDPEDFRRENRYMEAREKLREAADAKNFRRSWFIGWRLRREAEGGPALVQAWARIVDDFNNSIE